MRKDWNTCKLHNIKWDSSQTKTDRVREREGDRETATHRMSKWKAEQ